VAVSVSPPPSSFFFRFKPSWIDSGDGDVCAFALFPAPPFLFPTLALPEPFRDLSDDFFLRSVPPYKLEKLDKRGRSHLPSYYMVLFSSLRPTFPSLLSVFSFPDCSPISHVRLHSSKPP